MLDPEAQEWDYGWKCFFGHAFIEENSEGPAFPVTSVHSEEPDVDDATLLVARYNKAGVVFPFMHFFEYAYFCTDRLGVGRFVLGMSVCEVDVYFSDVHTLRLTAEGGCVSR